MQYLLQEAEKLTKRKYDRKIDVESEIARSDALQQFMPTKCRLCHKEITAKNKSKCEKHCKSCEGE